MIMVAVPLTFVSYQLTKVFYQGIINQNSPLFVPKVFGFGFTINPYHKGTKIIYSLLLIFLIGLILFLIQAPASSIIRK